MGARASRGEEREKEAIAEAFLRAAEGEPDGPDLSPIMREVGERWPGDALAAELFGVEERADLLHNLCCLPSVEGMQRYHFTSDGFFLGERVGDIGANAFLGQPPAYVVARNRGHYLALSEAGRRAVRLRLGLQGIPLWAVVGRGALTEGEEAEA